MAKSKSYNYITLQFKGGERVEISYPTDMVEWDEFYEDLKDCIEQGKMFWVENYEHCDCEANWRGILLRYINCRDVIGYN